MGYTCVSVSVSIMLAFLLDSAASASVRLTQETPCLPTQSCRLQCLVVSGTNVNGLGFFRNTLPVVTCPVDRDDCRSDFPGLYSHTQVGYSTSYVDIRSFDASVDAITWRCGEVKNGTLYNLTVVQNALPNGTLTYGSTCDSGRATSPASLTCSGLSPGVPPATLSIVDSSNASAGSSQTGSVTRTVITGGQASCSVTWSAFPSYSLNIRPVPCDVQVAASVRNITVQGKVITCLAEGHPDAYTFKPWLQSWGKQEVRNVTGIQKGGQYSLTLISYQDSGTYTCSVDNGVPDSSGQTIRRTANFNVTVEDAPVPVPSDPPSVAGEDGEPVRLFRSLYDLPVVVNHTWFFNSTDVTSLVPGATTNRSRDMVLLPVHGTTVTTEGTVINLYLTVSQQYSGLYRVQACNRIGCKSAIVTLRVASAPLPPESLAVKPSTDRVELSWTPGFAGGDFFQWFHIQYRRQDSQEGQWTNVSTADNRSSSDRTPVTVTVQGLQPDTSYVFRVGAQSSRPQRNLSNYTEVTLKTSPNVLSNAGPNTAALAGGIIGGLLGLTVLVVVIIVVVRKRRGRAGEDDKPLQKMAMQDTRRGNANPGFTSNPGKGPYQPVHPILEDNILYESSSNNVPQSPPDSAVYAVVDKKDKKAKAAGQGKKGDKKDKKGKTGSKIYENSDGATASGQVPEKPGPVRENVDGLMYSTVVIDRKPGEAARPALAKAAMPSRPDDQYKDEKVVYTAIDHTKRV